MNEDFVGPYREPKRKSDKYVSAEQSLNDPPQSFSTEVQCWCGKILSSQKNLERHQLTVHGTRRHATTRTQPQPSHRTLRKCPLCYQQIPEDDYAVHWEHCFASMQPHGVATKRQETAKRPTPPEPSSPPAQEPNTRALDYAAFRADWLAAHGKPNPK